MSKAQQALRPPKRTLSDNVRLSDANFWKTYTDAICKQQDLKFENGTVPKALGTWPVFVNNQYAFKLFPKFGDDGANGEEGRVAYEREVASSSTLKNLSSEISHLIPHMVCHGTLLDESDKGGGYVLYIVYTFVDGVPVKNVSKEFTQEDFSHIAYKLGHIVAKLHDVRPSPEEEGPARVAWQKFVLERRAGCINDIRYKWKSMPDHFVDEIDSYLPKDIVEFLAAGPLSLIHCDLIRDHVLVTKVDDKWEITGIIDFGDARYGDIFYDLPALLTNQFRTDKSLLLQFLKGYNEKRGESVGFSRDDFVYRAMTSLLIYEFNQFQNLEKGKGVFVHHPEFLDLKSLGELADRIWGAESLAI